MAAWTSLWDDVAAAQYKNRGSQNPEAQSACQPVELAWSEARDALALGKEYQSQLDERPHAERSSGPRHQGTRVSAT